MTAFSSIYTSLTGLFSFSQALNTVSDNVANLNTPGFKSNDVLFRDLGLSDTSVGDGVISREPIASGNGVEVRGTVRRFSQGEFQGTSSPTDLAIDGNGFFVVRQDNFQRYTRAGQFTFDTDGYLVDAATGARAQALANGNQLNDLLVSRNQTRPPVATTVVNFTNNLSTGGGTFTVSNIDVVDAGGNSRTLTGVFTNNTSVTPGSWLVTINDEQSNQLLSGEIRFQGSGSPADNFKSLDVVLPAGGSQSTIKLNFDAATSFSTGSTSTLQVGTSDGSNLGVLTQVTIDRLGVVQLGFSNGDTATGQRLALANFADPQSLVEVGASSFEVVSDARIDQPQFGYATEEGLGQLRPSNIELANVNLSQEFSNIIVLQRAYQGSSQVLNVSSQLLEQLYNNLSSR